MNMVRLLMIATSLVAVSLSVGTAAFAASKCSCDEEVDVGLLPSCVVYNMWKDKQQLSVYGALNSDELQYSAAGAKASCDTVFQACMNAAYIIPEGTAARAACKANGSGT